MATNAYLGRMEELTNKKEANTSKIFSLPSIAPLNKRAPGMAGNPAPQPEVSPVPDMTTPFGRKFTAYSERDPSFTPMMQEFTALTSGLKEQVSNGYMPEVMAKKNLERYIMDMSGQRKSEAEKPTQPSFDPKQFAELVRAKAGIGMASSVGLDEKGVPKALAGVLKTLKAQQEAQNDNV